MRFPGHRNIGRRPTAIALAGVALVALGVTACSDDGGSGDGSPADTSTPTEVDITDDPSERYGELQLAINPTDPENIVAATVGLGYTHECRENGDPNCELLTEGELAREFGIAQPRGLADNVPGFAVVYAFVSFDRGETWERVAMPRNPKGHRDLYVQGDPTVAVAPDGTFYLGWDAIHFEERCDFNGPIRCIPTSHGGIAVSTSTDGGLTWSRPVLSGISLDGPKLDADPNTGTIYAHSSGVLPSPTASGDKSDAFGPADASDRWVVSSEDGVNWTEPQRIGVPPGGLIPQADLSAARGVLAAVFNSTDTGQCGSTPPPCTIFETSTDAGATWSRHVVPAPTTTVRPMVAADPSTDSQFAVAILVDNQFQVFETKDSGESWRGPVVVSEDAKKPHFLPWMEYSPEGVLGLMWRTCTVKTCGTTPISGLDQPYNVWAAISTDGGATFSDPVQMSSGDSPPSDPVWSFGDDYSAIALDDERIYVGWADWRPGERADFVSWLSLTAFATGMSD